MDVATVSGIVLLAALAAGGAYAGQFTAALINLHGVLIVLGGTAVAMLINSPAAYLRKAALEIRSILAPEDGMRPEKMIGPMVELAEQCRQRGLAALKDADPAAAGGFLARAAAAALEYNDYKFVKQVLEEEINQALDEKNEVANVYRTMGVMAPMFGLLGTLIGIIGVLKDLASPENVGPAMAMAITSAFYGIVFSNLVCVPVAGKIRARGIMETHTRSMIMEGILEIMKGSLPMVVERRLQSFCR